MADVSSYAGFRYPERPRAFHWEGIKHVVEKVLGEWRTPERLCFRVRCVDGSQFEMCYQSEDEVWSLRAMNAVSVPPRRAA